MLGVWLDIFRGRQMVILYEKYMDIYLLIFQCFCRVVDCLFCLFLNKKLGGGLIILGYLSVPDPVLGMYGLI